MHSTWFISSKLFAFAVVVGRLVNGSGFGWLPVWMRALRDEIACCRNSEAAAAATGDTFAFYAFLVKQLTLIEYAIYAAICKRKWLFAKNYYCPSWQAFWAAAQARPHPYGMRKPQSWKPFRASILTALNKYYEYEYCSCRLRVTEKPIKTNNFLFSFFFCFVAGFCYSQRLNLNGLLWAAKLAYRAIFKLVHVLWSGNWWIAPCRSAIG